MLLKAISVIYSFVATATDLATGWIGPKRLRAREQQSKRCSPTMLDTSRRWLCLYSRVTVDENQIFQAFGSLGVFVVLPLLLVLLRAQLFIQGDETKSNYFATYANRYVKYFALVRWYTVHLGKDVISRLFVCSSLRTMVPILPIGSSQIFQTVASKFTIDYKRERMP